jgi:hypothetical protein
LIKTKKSCLIYPQLKLGALRQHLVKLVFSIVST